MINCPLTSKLLIFAVSSSTTSFQEAGIIASALSLGFSRPAYFHIVEFDQYLRTSSFSTSTVSSSLHVSLHSVPII